MKTTVTLRSFILLSLSVLLALSVSGQTAAATQQYTATGDKEMSVKLVSFSGSANGNKADLKWVTTAEKNFSHFIIEKSTDGVNFSDAGVFFAYGTSNDMTNYSFSFNLENTSSPVVYYRLFLTGNDGKGFYSDLCTVKTGK